LQTTGGGTISPASKYFTNAMYDDLLQCLPAALRLSHAAVHALAIHSSFKYLFFVFKVGLFIIIYFRACYNAMAVSQMIVQAMWFTDNPLLQLPHINDEIINLMKQEKNISTVDEFLALEPEDKVTLLSSLSVEEQVDVVNICTAYPNINISYEMAGQSSSNPTKQKQGKSGEDDEEELKEFTEGEEVVVTVLLDRALDEDEDEDGDSGEIGSDDAEEEIILKDPNALTGTIATTGSPPIVPSIHFPLQKEEGWWLLIGMFFFLYWLCIV
jgi:hypothetical protein